jgi:hypothetical protein
MCTVAPATGSRVASSITLPVNVMFVWAWAFEKVRQRPKGTKKEIVFYFFGVPSTFFS